MRIGLHLKIDRIDSQQQCNVTQLSINIIVKLKKKFTLVKHSNILHGKSTACQITEDVCQM